MQKSPAILCVHVFQRVTMLACGSTLPKRSECVQKQVSYKGEKGVGFSAARSGYDTRVMLRRGSGGETGNSAHRLHLQQVGLGGDEFLPACLPLASVYLHYVPPLIQTLQWFSCVRECKTSLPPSLMAAWCSPPCFLTFILLHFRFQFLGSGSLLSFGNWARFPVGNAPTPSNVCLLLTFLISA